MMKFEYQYEDGAPKVTIELPSDSTLDQALESFKSFLLAVGYSFNGDLDIVSTDFPEPEEEEVTQ